MLATHVDPSSSTLTGVPPPGSLRGIAADGSLRVRLRLETGIPLQQSYALQQLKSGDTSFGT